MVVCGIEMFDSKLCELLSIDMPILTAPMRFGTGPEMAGAVSKKQLVNQVKPAAMTQTGIFALRKIG